MADASVHSRPRRTLHRHCDALREGKFIKTLLPLGISLVRILRSPIQSTIQHHRYVGLRCRWRVRRGNLAQRCNPPRQVYNRGRQQHGYARQHEKTEGVDCIPPLDLYETTWPTRCLFSLEYAIAPSIAPLCPLLPLTRMFARGPPIHHNRPICPLTFTPGH